MNILIVYKKQITIICIILALFAFYQSIKNPNEETIKKLGQYKFQEIQLKKEYAKQYGIAEGAKKGMSESHLAAESVRKDAEKFEQKLVIHPDTSTGISASGSDATYTQGDGKVIPQSFSQPTE